MEGPISRLLITVDDSEKIVLDSGEDFNLEAFVLRVMSVWKILQHPFSWYLQF